MLWFNKGQASLIRVLPQRRNTQCALHNTLLKSPYCSLCSRNSDPLFTIPGSNYDTTLSLLRSPSPVQAGSWATGAISKTIPRIRHDSIVAILCLSGERQSLYLIETHQKHISWYILEWQNWDEGGGYQGLVWSIKKEILHESMQGWQFTLVSTRTEHGDNKWLCVSSRLRSCTRQKPSTLSPELRWLIHWSSCFTGSTGLSSEG